KFYGDLGHIVEVEVAPSVAPGRGHAVPAEVASGQRGLDRLGETGLSGAVAADDHGQAGAGREFEGGGAADAAEALDAHPAEVAAPGVPCRRNRFGVRESQ